MLASLRNTLFVLLLTCLVVSASWCAPITAVLRAADKRLETPVTLTEPRIYLGELLERLSAQSGVTLKTYQRENASSLQVTISVQRTPLVDVLNGLYSLVSYRDAGWRWEREGEQDKGTNFTYRFSPSDNAKSLSARLRHHAQTEFEHQAASLLAALKMTPSERDGLARKDPETGLIMSSSRIMSGIGILAEVVPAERLPGLLRDKDQIRIPFSALSLQGQEFIRSEFTASQSTAPFPTDIKFYATGFPQGMASCLIMEIGSIGGYAYVGGMPLERKLDRELEDLWILPGDQRQNSRETRKLPIVADESQKAADFSSNAPFNQEKYLTRPQHLPVHLVEERLLQLARRASVSLLALTPSSQENTGNPSDQLVAKYLATLYQSDMHIMHKWRDSILLVNYRASACEAEKLVPLATIRELRDEERKGNGWLPLHVLVDSAETLSDLQLNYLAAEFPVMQNVVSSRTLLTLYRNFPSIRSDRGISITPEIAALMQAQPGLPAVKEDLRQVRIRLVEKSKPEFPNTKFIELHLYSDDGRFLGGYGFSYRAHQLH